MLKDVLIKLRKYHRLSQEEVAEKCHVSRQAVSKWETGASVPDVYSCIELYKLFSVSMDDLLESDTKDFSSIAPKDKFMFGYVQIGEDLTLKLTEESLEKMRLKRGDKLICLGDLHSGLAFVPVEAYEEFAKGILKAKEDFEHESHNNK